MFFILVSCSNENIKELSYSLDQGQNYMTQNDKYDMFDIYKEVMNDEVTDVVFFYAFTYAEFQTKAEEARLSKHFEWALSLDEFNQAIDDYDESYFADHMVLIYFKHENNVSENYVYSVTKEDRTLTVNVNRFDSVLTANSTWLEVVTLHKSDVKNIDNVNLLVRTIGECPLFITLHINDAYLRYIYLNGISEQLFRDIDNLKEIRLSTEDLQVRLAFTETINNDDLETILQALDDNPHIENIET